MDTNYLTGVLLAIIEAVADADMWAAEAEDQEDLLARFALIDDALRALKEAHAAVGHEVLLSADNGDEVPGGGTLRFGGGNAKKVYDVELLRGKVADACATLVGMDEDPRIEAVVEAAWSVAPTSPSAGFRVTGAKRLGIRLRDYCVEESTPLTVRIEDRPTRVSIGTSQSPVQAELAVVASVDARAGRDNPVALGDAGGDLLGDRRPGLGDGGGAAAGGAGGAD